MRERYARDTFVNRALESAAVLIDRWWMKYFVSPVATMLPPVIVVFYVRHPSTKAVSETLLAAAQHFVESHSLSALLLVSIYVIVLKAIGGLIRMFSVKNDGIDSKGLLTLFEVLEGIVGAKAGRFGELVKRYLEGSAALKANEVFEKITQPDQQLALIAKGVYSFFDALDKDGVSFRVSVVGVNDGRLDEWVSWEPHSEPPRTSLDILQSDESSISNCLNTGNIVIIPDIRAEAKKVRERKYVKSASDGEEEGSLLCYPVHHKYSQSVPYVVTVIADKKGYFQVEKSKLYQWIFRHFGVRMGLEHSLLLLKKGVQSDD